MPGRPRLGQLVRHLLAAVPDLPRLRLSSIDPAEPDHDLMEILQREERLMPHLHLSIQHGDDLILKRMKRRHLARDVIRFCDEARRRRPDIVFGADMIAGFPTETVAAHTASLDLIKRAGITFLHVFPFSPREGTPAALMPQLDGNLIRERAAELRHCGRARLCARTVGGTSVPRARRRCTRSRSGPGRSVCGGRHRCMCWHGVSMQACGAGCRGAWILCSVGLSAPLCGEG